MSGDGGGRGEGEGSGRRLRRLLPAETGHARDDDQGSDDPQEEGERIFRRDTAGGLVHALPRCRLVQEPQASTGHGVDPRDLGEVRLGRRLPTGTGPERDRSARRTDARTGVGAGNQGVLDPAPGDDQRRRCAEEGTGGMVERVLAVVRDSGTEEAPEVEDRPSEGAPDVESGRLCGSCVHGYIGAHGVFCVEYSEFIWNEECAQHCGSFEE